MKIFVSHDINIQFGLSYYRCNNISNVYMVLTSYKIAVVTAYCQILKANRFSNVSVHVYFKSNFTA